MRIPYFVVDAFAREPFRGNPAGVCPLESWLPDSLMQAIAAENRLSETAFFVRGGTTMPCAGSRPAQRCACAATPRWPPRTCCSYHLGALMPRLEFRTHSGPLFVERRGELLALDFQPCRHSPGPWRPPGGRPAVSDPKPSSRRRTSWPCCPTPRPSARLTPDLEAIAALGGRGLVITAPGVDCDFVSRFFAPASGVPEDPVTGSTHCTLTPYWAERLGKKKLHARQLSARGGELFCTLHGDRVDIAGAARDYLHGHITLPDAAL